MTSRKQVALLLAFLGPFGIGHFHVGRRRRGALWLALAAVGLVALGILVVALGPRVGWTVAVVAALALVLSAFTLSVIDLARVAEGPRTPIWQTLIFAAIGFATPAAASAILRTFVLESFVVPTRSMEPTVLAGDRIFARRLTWSGAAAPMAGDLPRYGDIVVLDSPEHPGEMLVKRVVARPGDVLEMRRGRPWVNGWQVPSCALGEGELGSARGEVEVEFLGDASYLVFYDAAAPVAEHAGPLYAAKDAVLVLGDDRNDSADSRAWHDGRDGNVHARALRGRALFVWLRTSAADDARFGVDLARPRLPSSLAKLQPALDRCLGARPPSTPPPALVR